MCDDFAEGENFEDLGIKSSISLMKIVFQKCKTPFGRKEAMCAQSPTKLCRIIRGSKVLVFEDFGVRDLQIVCFTHLESHDSPDDSSKSPLFPQKITEVVFS